MRELRRGLLLAAYWVDQVLRLRRWDVPRRVYRHVLPGLPRWNLLPDRIQLLQLLQCGNLLRPRPHRVRSLSLRKVQHRSRRHQQRGVRAVLGGQIHACPRGVCVHAVRCGDVLEHRRRVRRLPRRDILHFCKPHRLHPVCRRQVSHISGSYYAAVLKTSAHKLCKIAVGGSDIPLIGRFSLSGAQTCSSCLAGTYSGTGQSSCTVCPVGTQAATSASACHLLPGKYFFSPTAGWPASGVHFVAGGWGAVLILLQAFLI